MTEIFNFITEIIAYITYVPEGVNYAIGPLVVPLIASLVSGGIKAGKGIAQSLKASQINPVRPRYERPEEFKRYVERKRAQAGGGKYPGQDADEERLELMQARANERIKEVAGDSFSTLHAVTKAARDEVVGQREIRQEARRDKVRRQLELDRAELQASAQSDKEFEFNKAQPYQDAAATKSALLGASTENITGGFSDIAGAVAQYSVGKKKEKDKTDATTNTTTSSVDLTKKTGPIATVTQKPNVVLDQKAKGKYDEYVARIKAANPNAPVSSFDEWKTKFGIPY